ncbi:MAG: helix-turn-helix domain-containing protein [Aquificaceae bacterium]
MARSFEVEINPEIIKWARETAGWSIEEVARKLKISKENYQKLESGSKNPTFRQLEILANYFKRPIATFFLPKPPEEPSIASSFRILPKNKGEFSKGLHLAIRKAHYYQSIFKELIENLGRESKPEIKTLSTEDDPKKAAQDERENSKISFQTQFKWKNAYEAFNAWRDYIESKNILVFEFNFPIEDARGFCLIKDPPVIVINSADNILARIFTLFHEYAHIILGRSEIYSEEIITDPIVENWCNIFASEFLIPEKALKEDKDFLNFISSKKLEPKVLENLSKKFKVSQKAILTKLKILNLIEQEDYERESALIEKTKFPQKGGFLSPEEKCIREKGKRFISLVLESNEKGIITTQDVLEYLSIKLKHLDKVQELIAK